MRYDYVYHGIIPYLQKIDIRTCIYCNVQYAATAKKQNGTYEVFYELDHFYPNSLYPFLCTNFYNLQSYCGACNKHKSNKRIHSIYIQTIGMKKPLHFSSVLTEGLWLTYIWQAKNGWQTDCFDAPSNTTLRDNHKDCFHITALYAAFKDVAEEIIWKHKAWDET